MVVRDRCPPLLPSKVEAPPGIDQSKEIDLVFIGDPWAQRCSVAAADAIASGKKSWRSPCGDRDRWRRERPPKLANKQPGHRNRPKERSGNPSRQRAAEERIVAEVAWRKQASKTNSSGKSRLGEQWTPVCADAVKQQLAEARLQAKVAEADFRSHVSDCAELLAQPDKQLIDDDPCAFGSLKDTDVAPVPAGKGDMDQPRAEVEAKDKEDDDLIAEAIDLAAKEKAAIDQQLKEVIPVAEKALKRLKRNACSKCGATSKVVLSDEKCSCIYCGTSRANSLVTRCKAKGCSSTACLQCAGDLLRVAMMQDLEKDKVGLLDFIWKRGLPTIACFDEG